MGRIKIVLSLLLCLFFFSNSVIAEDLINKFGIGKDTFSYSNKNGIFLRFFPCEFYYIKLGGSHYHNYKAPIRDMTSISLINGFYLRSLGKFKFLSELDITLNYEYDAIFNVRYNDYYDFGINVGLEYFINTYFSIGYKFGYYYRYNINYSDRSKYHLFNHNFRNSILEGLILYFYFN